MKNAARIAAKPESGRANGKAQPFFTRADNRVQTKLKVSTPDDKYEREADNAADAVVHGRGPMSRGGQIAERVTSVAQRSPEGEAQMSCERASDPAFDEHEPVMRPIPPVVEDEPLQMQEEEEAVQAAPEEALRQEEEEEELMPKREEAQRQEDEAQLQEEEEEEELMPKREEAQRQEEEEAQTAPEEAQTKGAGQPDMDHRRPSARAVRMQTVERQLRAARGRGNPLPEAVRQRMQSGMGADFSGVRIHTDAPAFEMTKLLRAKAFASGKDIFFSPDRFSPGTTDGDHLLAHELAHTLQQGAVPTHEDATAQRVAEDDRIFVRPESLKAIQIARGYIGQINSTLHGPDGNRIGWQRLQAIFREAFGGDAIAPALVKRIITSPDQLPHWCGIFAWHALRKAGLPLPPWKPGANMLANAVQRPAGELPQKGDIAFRIFAQGKDKVKANMVNHQALVTGVESSETAAGKDFKAIKVRTVDGNTAGADNLGGQVEEKWQPIGAWDAFFNPAGKLDLPDVPLVETDRASEDAGPVASEGAAKPEEVGAASEDPAAGSDAADVDVAPTLEAEPLAGADAEVAVDLPPVPDASVEPPAKVEKLALGGSSDEAMTSFVDAPASAMAATASSLGSTLDGKTASEKKAVATEAPTLTAKTGGEVDPGVTPPDQLPVPGDTALEDQGKGPEVGDIKPEPYEEKGAAPSTKQTRDEVKRQSSGGGFLDWIRNQFANILNGLKTRDDSVNTSAGPRKRVALTGDADVGRMEQQRQDGTGKLKAQRDEKVAAFKGHPGQTNIQPRQIDEARPTTVSPETSEPVEELPPDDGVADFAAAELPKNVRDAADGKLGPNLKTNLKDARTKTTEAARTRDADKAAEIAEAERKTAQANKDADEGQRKAVLAGRTDVARQQGEAIGSAFDNVAEFTKDAGKRQTDDQKKISSDVKTEEGKADTALEDGEKEAKRVKKEKEAEAAAKKAELKEKKEKQGLLSRAVGFVKDVVNAITEAIDGIFNALRSLVKKAIEAAKNAAIGFINAARNAVISKLNDFRDWAKDKVNTYVKDRFPGLASALNKGIDATVDVAVAGVNAAADGAIEVVEAAANALGKALDRVLAAFQAGLKAAVRIAGAVLTGDFAGALRIAIEAGCEIAGVDSKPIFDFMERAGNQLTEILKSPGKFINNVMTAIGMGVRQFAENFGQHFKTGVIEWLTGALSAVPITLPSKWDIKGFFSLVAQILGLTYENIKARVILKFPKAAKVFDAVETGFKYIKMLVNKDYSGLWEEVKSKLADLKDSIIGAIRNWTIINVIKEGVIWLLSLMNPASALVKALKLIADLIFWLIDNFQRIKAFILSVYDAVAKIASGILAPAAKAIENAMARSLPVVISFVASAIGLGGIGAAVQGVIQKLTAPINKMIDAIIDKIVAFAKKLWGKTKEGAKAAKDKAKAGAKALKDKLINWWKERRGFTSKDGGKHELYYKGTAARAELWVASTPQPLERYLAGKKTSTDKDQARVAGRALRLYNAVLKTETRLDTLQKKKTKTDADKKKINSLVLQLRTQLKAVSDELKNADFSAFSTVQTKVTFSPGSPKTVLALPLAYLPGKTKGSSPREDPPGWKHAADLNALEGTSGEWVRGHLLNDNLHGPGQSKNLVPITKTMNSSMESKVEGPAKTALKTKKRILFYEATATFWGGSGKSADFPKKVQVTWGDATKSGSTYTKGAVQGSKPFEMKTRPPDTVKRLPPSIPHGSPTRILNEIRTYNSDVTSYFVNAVLIPGQSSVRYASAPNMRKRLYTDVRAEITANQGTAAATTRQAYVGATYQAIVNRDITVK